MISYFWLEFCKLHKFLCRTVDGNDVNADFSVDVKELDLDLKECTYRMTIPSTELSDTGTYKVKVKNKFDSAESSVSENLFCRKAKTIELRFSHNI